MSIPAAPSSGSRPSAAFGGTLALACAAGLALCLASPAMAQSSCEKDFASLAQKREASIKAIQAVMGNGKRKIDASVACSRFRALVSAERELISYMIKNKDWCQIPDAMIEQAKGGNGRTASTANQACNAAAMQKKMREQAERQAAEGGGGGAPPQPLPAGPL